MTKKSFKITKHAELQEKYYTHMKSFLVEIIQEVMPCNVVRKGNFTFDETYVLQPILGLVPSLCYLLKPCVLVCVTIELRQ